MRQRMESAVARKIEHFSSHRGHPAPTLCNAGLWTYAGTYAGTYAVTDREGDVATRVEAHVGPMQGPMQGGYAGPCSPRAAAARESGNGWYPYAPQRPKP